MLLEINLKLFLGMGIVALISLSLNVAFIFKALADKFPNVFLEEE